MPSCYMSAGSLPSALSSRTGRCAFLTLLLCTTAGAATAQTRDGSGDSYWGAIPPPADSVSAVFASGPRPVWETVLLVPYWIIGLPLRLVAVGVGEGVELLDGSGVASTVAGWLGPRTGPFGVIISARAGGLSGVGGGVAVEHTELFNRPGTAFRGRVAGTFIGDFRASGAVRVPFAERSLLDLGTGYRFRNRVRYFGIGPERGAEDESLFRQRTWWVGGEVTGSWGDQITTSASLVFTSVKPLDAREADQDGDDPPITVRYADSLPPGFGETSNGLALGAEIMHQDATDTGRPVGGGIRRAMVGYFRGTGGETTQFWNVRGELQQFVPLWYRHHVLALRLLASWMQQIGDAPIPFTRLITNDDPDLLRGFDDFRWRDRGLAVLSAEYRWPLWASERAEGAGLDLYLLTDVGQVFSDFDDIRGRNLTFSYGAGLRLLTAAGFALRIEYARSNEDAVFRLRGDQIFQTFRSALYHGRDPNPAR